MIIANPKQGHMFHLLDFQCCPQEYRRQGSVGGEVVQSICTQVRLKMGMDSKLG